MVAQFAMRTYGVNQAFRLVEGIWLHRKGRQVRNIFLGKDFFYFICAQHVLSYHLIKVPSMVPSTTVVIMNCLLLWY